MHRERRAPQMPLLPLVGGEAQKAGEAVVERMIARDCDLGCGGCDPDSGLEVGVLTWAKYKDWHCHLLRN